MKYVRFTCAPEKVTQAPGRRCIEEREKLPLPTIWHPCTRNFGSDEKRKYVVKKLKYLVDITRLNMPKISRIPLLSKIVVATLLVAVEA